MDLTFLVNHLFLPPKLPQEDDSASGGPQALLSHVRKSTMAFFEVVFGDKNVDNNIIHSWMRLQKTLRWMDDLHVQGLLLLESLHEAISGMDVDGALSPLF